MPCSGLHHCTTQYSVCSPITVHITCVSCGAAAPVQVLQDHAEEFFEKMNSKVIAPQLKALGLIPEAVECDIRESGSKEEANALLFSHLKENANRKAVINVFGVASDEAGYGKMNTFAASVLKKLPQQTINGFVRIGVHTLTCCCSVQYSTCVYINKSLCNVIKIKLVGQYTDSGVA